MTAREGLALEICPRCAGPIEIREGVKIAAGSRAAADREVGICGMCGTDEALREESGYGVIPVTGWPMHDPHEFAGPLQERVNALLAERGVEL